VGAILVIVSVVPWNTVGQGESPFTLALSHPHVQWASAAMAFVILAAVLSCLNSAFYVSSRVLFSLARHGDAPKSLVRLNPRGVPSRSVLVGCSSGVLGVVAAMVAPTTLFAFLVNASGAIMLFVYLAVAAAQVHLRQQRMRGSAPAPVVRMWLFPWASYLAIAGMLAVMIAMVFTLSMADDFYFSVVALLLTSAVYAIRRRRPARRAAGEAG
jgi:GABA permease